MELLSTFLSKSKENKSAFYFELVEQPFVILGSLLAGVNVIVNPTPTAALAFVCFSIGSVCGLISGYKRHSLSILTVGFHTILNFVTLYLVLLGL